MSDVEFKLKSSLYFTLFFSALFISSVLIVLCLQINIFCKLIGIVSVVAYSKYIFQRYVFLSHPKSILSIRRLSDGRILVITRNQHYNFFAEICGDSTVTQLIMVLRFARIDISQVQAESTFKIFIRRLFTTPCVILPDSFLQRDDYRKLIVTLRYARA